MSDAAAPVPAATIAGVPRRVFVVGSGVLVALTAFIATGSAWRLPLQAVWFDTYQSISPRVITSTPAVAVEIDEASLNAIGRWPWPRSQLAELVDAIARQHPAAIGIDILMPEPDPLSAERLVERARKDDPVLAARLEAQPSNDHELARSVAAAPTVLAIAGTPDPRQHALRAAPFSIYDKKRADGDAGASAAPIALARFEDVLTSRDEIDRAAAGHGLISVEPTGGVIRAVPLAADVHGTLVPALSVEMLRVAMGVPQLRLLASGRVADAIAIGDFIVPTAADASVRPYYSPRSALRIVSARDVLQGRVAADRFEHKLVLIGVTGLGLLEYQNTPLGVRMPGVEIHAQLLENLFDDTLLKRPAWIAWLEAGLFFVLGAALIFATPRWKPRNAALLAFSCIAALGALGYLLFRGLQLLFDAAIPGASLTLLFGVLLVLTLTESTRLRKALELTVQRQREQSARMSGELEAARRVQTATLPRTSLLAGDARLDLAAIMRPAREVGGDLYDFFRLDERRLFLMAGDVAGKGLTASIFMAVSKALYKSATLRDPNADIGAIMSAANREISRDNSEMLFVTVFAAILDLETGDLDYCNAGHENPSLLEPGGASIARLDDAGGPPLCTVEHFAYVAGHRALHAGATLCIVSDGVIEARNPEGAMYGKERLDAALSNAGRLGAATSILDSLCAHLERFSASAGQDDDQTYLVLLWKGPPFRGAAGARRA
ncbi:MAG TPA: CHASE2 domain-containing protein [Casimicrobiaceae bacterium]